MPLRAVRGTIVTDVDGDGDVDLVLRGGVPIFGSPEPNVRFVNDGNFATTAQPWPARTMMVQTVAPTRLATFALPVPRARWLHGVALYAQALLISPIRPGAERLTGACAKCSVRS